MTEPTPVTLIGGYLGAGKTTLVNSLLRNAADAIRTTTPLSTPDEAQPIAIGGPKGETQVSAHKLAAGVVVFSFLALLGLLLVGRHTDEAVR